MLAELVAGAVADAADRRSARSHAVVEAEALARPAALDVMAALAPTTAVRVIAEVKRASPSRGPLAEIPDPAKLAKTYQAGGASAISVLTEGRKFGGSLEDLAAVRGAVSIPVLRKDFIAVPYQVLEARAAGADLILLMASALDQPTLKELYDMATQLGMTPLVETHDANELERASEIGAQVIGVNARNLDTFELDRSLFASLVDGFPDGAIKVAESAVSTAADVANYRAAGADVVLVGEALVTSDPIKTLAEFLAV